MPHKTNRNVSIIAVVGAGTMGSGIAQKYAAHGHKVTIIDKAEASLCKSKQIINQNLEQAVQRNIFSVEEINDQKARMSFSSDLTSAKHAELVIEAIFEDLVVKQQLFISLDGLCNKNVVLATNTSSLMVADLLRGLVHPERVLGLHYFYPPSKNRLVEIISTDRTSKDAVIRAKNWQTSINKTVIYSKDSPGFIVNRFFVPWLNESMRIVKEANATIGTVEKAAQNFFQIGMGPFALMNATGLPITFHSCAALSRALGEFYAPSELIVPQMESRVPWELASDIDEQALANVALRLLAVVASVSCQMVFEENVCTTDDADLGAQAGLLWKKGPFALLREHHRDIARALATMKLQAKKLPNTSALEKYLASQ